MRVLILHFGSQVTRLLARRVREAGVYCEILPCTVPERRIADFVPKAATRDWVCHSWASRWVSSLSDRF